MARRIPNVEVDREAAQSLKSALGLDNYIPPGYTMIDVSSIVMDWISTGNCRPDKLVQALTLTKGLGQYVSRLSCKYMHTTFCCFYLLLVSFKVLGTLLRYINS